MPQLQPLWTLSPASCPQEMTKISFFDDMNRSVEYNLFSYSVAHKDVKVNLCVLQEPYCIFCMCVNLWSFIKKKSNMHLLLCL